MDLFHVSLAHGRENMRMKTTRGSILKRGRLYYVQWMRDGQRHFAPVEDTEGNRPKSMTAARAMADAMLKPYTLPDAAERAAALATRADTVRAAADAANPGLRLVRVWTEYVKARNRPDTGPATLRQYEFQVGAFVDWATKGNPDVRHMADVTPATARAYVAHLERLGRSANTVNKHLNILGLVWRVLAEPGRVPVNPWGKDRITRRRVSNGNGRRELTMPELKRLTDSATGELRTLLCIGMFTGLRLGDCCRLDWSEVNLGRNAIVTTPHKTAHTSGALVAIPIAPPLRRVLEETPAELRHGPIMPGVAREYDERQRQLIGRIQKHFTGCGIATVEKGEGGKRGRVVAGFHSMRHTFITQAVMAGWPESLVRSIVGHSSGEITKRYIHANVEATKALPALPDPLATEQKPGAIADRAPLPGWARDIILGMTGRNWKAARAALLK